MKKIEKNYPMTLLKIDSLQKIAYIKPLENYRDYNEKISININSDYHKHNFFQYQFQDILSFQLFIIIKEKIIQSLKKRKRKKILSLKEFLNYCVIKNEIDELISLIKKFDSMSMKFLNFSALFLIEQISNGFIDFYDELKESWIIENTPPSELDSYWTDSLDNLCWFPWETLKKTLWELYLSEIELSSMFLLADWNNQSDLEKYCKMEKERYNQSFNKNQENLNNILLSISDLKQYRISDKSYKFWKGITALNMIGRYRLKGLKRKYCFLIAALLLKQ